ncbi:MAG TPA: ATP-binding cassette domain-containing protein [Gemmatimonadaceae bacterium]|nr:ATP-binding cassette domain-containing protein [Gemmatimonadaceae bacterium]
MIPVLRADLSIVAYGDRTALRDIRLEISPGEIVGITGPVGAGKTTLALACAGLLGHAIPARIEGKIQHASLAPPLAGYVFDDPLAQFTGLGGTVEEEVAVGPENLAVPREAIRARVDRALAAADATHLAARPPDELSGGERQRVALACALALEAPLLVLDEPTAQLDPDATQRFGERLRVLAEHGTGVVLVSQDLDLLRALATRVLVLADGTARVSGHPAAVLEASEHADAVTTDTARSTPLFEARQLVAAYADRVVLDSLTLDVADGSAMAILGENGAGKTTLARVIMGLVPVREGSIIVGGRPLDGLPVHRRARHVGLVFQDPARQLFARTVLEEVAFGSRVLGAPARQAYDKAREALEAVDLTELEGVNPGDLAPQTQRLVAIAAAMASEPPVLILDEPTAGQDDEGKRRIAAAIVRQRKRGCAMVITHDLPFARRVCDHAVLLSNGRAASRVIRSAGHS